MTPFLLAAPALAGWRDDVAAARAACAGDPAPCAIADALFLREDRSGARIAQDPRLVDPATAAALAPLVLDRLLREDDPAVRRGLADAAVQVLLTAAERGETRWDAAWVELVGDPQPEVRALLVDGLRRAPDAVARTALRAAATHADSATRADAARTIGGRADLPAFEADLVHLAADADASVRYEAARSLRRAAGRGPLGDAAWTAISALVADADARTRAIAAELLAGR